MGCTICGRRKLKNFLWGRLAAEMPGEGEFCPGAAVHPAWLAGQVRRAGQKKAARTVHCSCREASDATYIDRRTTANSGSAENLERSPLCPKRISRPERERVLCAGVPGWHLPGC